MAKTSVINPFHRLYLTEGVGEVDIPSLFSSVLVPYVTQLYLPGNVVLRGMEGTGKTMLLSLLDTKVRLAFWSHPDGQADGDFAKGDPLAPDVRRYVGAGINLSNSKAFKLNEIRVSKDREENIRLSRAYFGDFVNCWVLRDLFASIETLIKELTARKDFEKLAEIGVTSDARKLNTAVKAIARDSSCPFLTRVRTVSEMRQTLETRLDSYLQLVSNPRCVLPPEIDKTRRPLGTPITAATQALKAVGVLAADTTVIVTIDQFEQLVRREPLDGDDEKNRRFIHEVEDLFSLRVPDVSYRVGTRPNATLKRCDERRDYVLLDLDQVLQRKEHSARPLINEFAEDAFRRRIAMSDIPHKDEIVASASPLRMVFGKSPFVAQRGRLCAPKNCSTVVRLSKKKDRLLAQLDKEVLAEAKLWLQRRARQDVIAASLGEAWLRQQWAKGETPNVSNWDAPNLPPWELPSKRWWKKERLPLAALQIAASNAQRLVYFGQSDIVQLSGDNIVAFICICREIWECDARYRVGKIATESGRDFEKFDEKRQAEGIRDASRIWHDKMKQRANGETIQRLVDELGKRLHKQLIEDRQMSYPGANGISFSKSDLVSDREIERLLTDATAECFLLQRDHTPKNLGRGKSIKWYLHPILAPYYEITVQHTKEPLYLNVKKLRAWLRACEVLSPMPDFASGKSINTDVANVDVKEPPKLSRGAKTAKSQSQKTLWPEDE